MRIACNESETLMFATERKPANLKGNELIIFKTNANVHLHCTIDNIADSKSEVEPSAASYPGKTSIS